MLRRELTAAGGDIASRREDPGGHARVHHRRLDEICAEILPGRFTLYARQLRRVVCRLAGDDDLGLVADADAVLARLRKAGLLSDSVIAVARERGLPDGTSPAILALVFGACAHPERPFRMAGTGLAQRLDRFLAVHQVRVDARDAVGEASALGAVQAALGRPPRESDLDLLADLSAARWGSRAGAADAEAEGRERREGAALWLATCTPNMVARVRDVWDEDAALVAFVREYLPSPPSSLMRRHDASARPDRGALLAHLRAGLPHTTEAVREASVNLEMAVWNLVSGLMPKAALADAVDRFWSCIWRTLLEGFPYYAFRARFPFWWKQCLRHYDFRAGRDEVFDPDAPAHNADLDGTLPQEVSPHLLFVYREGYRFIRATFFRRGNRAPIVGDREADPAGANRSVRTALDGLWQARLEAALAHDELPPAEIEAIATASGLPRTNVDVLARRLRRRFWAYTLARLDRLSNHQIRETPIPSGYLRRGATEYPLRAEPGVLTVTSLARAVPPDHPLLWAFVAHLLIGAQAHTGRRETWSFRRLMVEVWWWVCDPLFEELVAFGRTPADRVASAAMARPPFQPLVERLRRCEDEKAVEAFLDEADLDHEITAALDLVRTLVPAGALGAWSAAARRVPSHWLAPPWYLVVVERLTIDAALRRLRPDDDAESAVLRTYCQSIVDGMTYAG